MKYFSISTIESAYINITARTNNKFWGILAITSSVDCVVHPKHVYSLNIDNVSNLLEKQFCLVEQTKEYTRGIRWNVIFSQNWAEYISEKLLHNSPNIYDVLVWFFRREKFEDSITKQQLITKFLEVTNISKEVAEKLFVFDDRELEFTPIKYSESQLLASLNQYCNNTTSYTTITAEKSFIAANAGELSRAPFVQTLYAGQGAQECMILTQFDFVEYYGVSEGIRNNASAPQGSDFSLQKIFYGAPGTGKSHKIKEATMQQPVENVFRTTFHPDSDYATFVGCYKPTKVRKPVRDMAGNIALDKNKNEIYEETITYQFVPQAFTKAYIRAWQTDEPVFLVIEEINRGNCAQIFGDLFQLLDREDGASEYPIKPDSDLGNFIHTSFQKEGCVLNENSAVFKGETLILPANLYIWATMNTSDQSLFPIDSAFKRRWDWEYVPIENHSEKDYRIKVNGATYDWWTFIEAINKEVFDLTHSEDKQLGYFFVRPQNGIIDANMLVNKVYFYLWNDVFKDYDIEGQKAFKKSESEAIAFKDFFKNGGLNEELAEQVLINLGVEKKY